MLFISNARSQFWRGSGLASARKAKKQSRLPVHAAIGGTVHREHAKPREEVIQHGENGLLDLSCVTRPSDENEPGLEINGDDRRGAHFVDKRVCLKAGSNNDSTVTGPTVEAVVLRAHEKLFSE